MTQCIDRHHGGIEARSSPPAKKPGMIGLPPRLTAARLGQEPSIARDLPSRLSQAYRPDLRNRHRPAFDPLAPTCLSRAWHHQLRVRAVALQIPYFEPSELADPRTRSTAATSTSNPNCPADVRKRCRRCYGPFLGQNHIPRLFRIGKAG